VQERVVGRHTVSDAHDDAGSVQILALLESEVFLNQGLVELAEALCRLVHGLRVFNSACCPFVIYFEIGSVVLLPQKIEKWLFISGEFDSKAVKWVFAVPGFHQDVTKRVHYTDFAHLETLCDGSCCLHADQKRRGEEKDLCLGQIANQMMLSQHVAQVLRRCLRLLLARGPR